MRRPPPDSQTALHERKRGAAMGRGIVDVAGPRPRTRLEARLRAGGGFDLDTADGAAAVDASVGFLLNVDKLNVGKLRT